MKSYLLDVESLLKEINFELAEGFNHDKDGNLIVRAHDLQEAASIISLHLRGFFKEKLKEKSDVGC